MLTLTRASVMGAIKESIVQVRHYLHYVHILLSYGYQLDSVKTLEWT